VAVAEHVYGWSYKAAQRYPRAHYSGPRFRVRRRWRLRPGADTRPGGRAVADGVVSAAGRAGDAGRGTAGEGTARRLRLRRRQRGAAPDRWLAIGLQRRPAARGARTDPARALSSAANSLMPRPARNPSFRCRGRQPLTVRPRGPGRTPHTSPRWPRRGPRQRTPPVLERRAGRAPELRLV